MTFSPLISHTIPHHNKYNERPGAITRIIQHHWAATTLSGEQALGSPKTKKSVTYLVYNDGRIAGQVPEEFRPWTSGGPAADNPSITIEVQNETGAPEWRISSAAQNSIERLIAEIAARRGWGALTSVNYTGHRQFAQTACPGPYVWPRLPEIRANANAINQGGTPQPKPPTTQPPASTLPPLVIDGSRGPKTISKWQETMGTPIDGVISKPESTLIKADQTFLNASVGTEHIQNLTGKPWLDVDGDEGEKTIIVRQFLLRNWVNPVHQQNLIGHLLDFDGILGPETNKVHQFALNHSTPGSKTYGQV